MMMMGVEPSRTCVVLGGRGFIGRHLVVRLLKLGGWIVRVADSDPSLQLDPSEFDSQPLSQALSTSRASYFQVDVRNKTTIINAIDGSSVVFFTDIDSCNNDFYYCYAIIVQGAKNVINACRQCKVKRLIYSSTADVVADTTLDIHNGDESLLYASNFGNVYIDLKAQAEALVLFANDIDGLLTCALRASNVFGPGDKQLMPSIVDIAKSGWAKFIIGSDESLCDFTYVENVAHALICAEDALGSRMVTVSGKVFFITNLEPKKFWEFVLPILEGLGYQRPMMRIPPVSLRSISFLIKWMHSKMYFKELNGSLSVYNVFQSILHSRTFNCSAAQQHIGYSPLVSLEEGVTLTIQAFPHLAKDISSARHQNFDEESKVEELLGCGKVADILLWRDDKKSFTCFLALALLHYWFFLCERTFISSTAKLMLLITVFLSGYGILTTDGRFGFSIPTLSSSCFEISEVDMRSTFLAMAHIWNRVGYITRTLAQGDDWNLFFKAIGVLYIFNFILWNLVTAGAIAPVFAFTTFMVYEQYEEEIDGLVEVLYGITRKAVVLLLRKPYSS